MQRITQLENIGSGMDCIVIGGGMSALEIDYEKCKHCDKIVVNDNIPKNVSPDYIVYNDINFISALRSKELYKKAVIISYVNAQCEEVHYTYRLPDFSRYGFNILDFHNTGLKSVIIAKFILGYDTVYMTGFDYTTVNGVSHHIGDDFGEGTKYPTRENLEGHYKRLDPMLAEWDVWTLPVDGVYNCNPDSSLKKFEFKLPYKE